jgi:signal transduction histidine kinase
MLRLFSASRRSIAQRLFISAIGWSVLLLLVAGLIFSTLYTRTAEQALDQRLNVYMRALVADLVASVEDKNFELGKLGEPQFELPLSGWYWQITQLSVENPSVKASRSLFAYRLPALGELGISAGIGAARQGYSSDPEGRRIRIVEREIEVDDVGSFRVQVAANTYEVERQVWEFQIILIVTFAVLALGLAGSSVLQVQFGLRPLRALRDEVAAIRRGERDKIEGRFPDDLAPLAGELNLLIAANREILERARTQVGNLAHALKTPLSVLLNEANGEKTSLADKVRDQVMVMRDQVTWYLDRARAAARAAVVGATTEVEPIVSPLLRTFEKVYAERAISFHGRISAGLRFRGERQDLQEIVGNLLDNAGKWANARVELAASALPEAADSRASLEVLIDDDGPGLPENLRMEALARGRRLDETKPGSGLGLAIVADLVAAHGGTIALEESPMGGLRVRLHLPAA